MHCFQEFRPVVALLYIHRTQISDINTIQLFFPVALRPNAGHGLLILEVSRSHTTTHQSVGFLWTSDQLVAVDLYLTIHNTHNRQTSNPPVGFEPTISVGERPHTYALDRAAIGTGEHSRTANRKYQVPIKDNLMSHHQ